ncbi:MAG: imidazolonepropionase [Acidobacteriota bacterium]|nr:imidazolonepropionase [Acidobacteriota bacterium]
MPSPLAVVNIGQLVTLAGPARPRSGAEMSDLGILKDAVLLIENGRIKAAGTFEDIGHRIEPHMDVVDADGRCVTPGFVDAHTHMVFAGNRAEEFELRIAGATYQQIAASGGGIWSTVRKTRDAILEELVDEARRHRNWMMRSGTTTMEAKSGYGLDHATELRQLRALAMLHEEGPATIVSTLLAAHTLPPKFASRRSDYVNWIAKELIPEVVAVRLAQYCDVFCDEHAFTVDEARVVLEAAKAKGLGLRIHADQFRPGSGAALAASLCAQTADHLEAITEPTIMRLLDANVQPVLLPGSVFALSRTQYAPARMMIDKGLGVVIATDFNPGSSPITSMPFVMSLACLYMGMTPAEALTASTVNAAYSLNLGKMIGTLEEGKRADFLVHEFRDYRELAYFVAVPARPRVFIAGAEL